MTTHYHLIVETPNANISNAIQWINVSYATYYNRTHHRQGHLFQGRFKSILINADDYLLELSRYIHRNPVMAMITELPEDYPWSSYRAYVKGGKAVPPWLERDRLLSYFETTTRKAMNRYRRFAYLWGLPLILDIVSAITSLYKRRVVQWHGHCGLSMKEHSTM
jgi:putative transposase